MLSSLSVIAFCRGPRSWRLDIQQIALSPLFTWSWLAVRSLGRWFGCKGCCVIHPIFCWSCPGFTWCFWWCLPGISLKTETPFNFLLHTIFIVFLYQGRIGIFTFFFGARNIKFETVWKARWMQHSVKSQRWPVNCTEGSGFHSNLPMLLDRAFPHCAWIWPGGMYASIKWESSSKCNAKKGP